MQFIKDHMAVFASLGIGVLDFLIAMNPKMESNGVIHMVYQFLAGFVGKKA